MIAAPGSGSGKTVISCALMAALKQKGMTVAAGKCGPDYIDPMFHREVLGIASQNLDLFFYEKEQLIDLFRNHAKNADITVMEGVMGYYDGMGIDTDRASSYEVAKTLGAPVVLVLSCRGSALSAAALVKGMIEFRKDSNIRGILLNQVSAMLYPRMKEMLERELQSQGHEIEVLGCIPKDPVLNLESRHLGLITPSETEGIRRQLKQAGELLAEHVDLDGILRLAGTAADFPQAGKTAECKTAHRVRIAVARDRAFCFYYKDNLEILERCGCELCFFSPLEDRELPQGTAGLILGGGYPELYAKQLSENRTMLEAIRSALKSGMPCHAECGGFLYLHRTLKDAEGAEHPMAGVIPAKAYPTGRLGRFGYITLKAEQDGIYFRRGESVKGHEFHYWDSKDNGACMTAVKPDGKRSWSCIHMKDALLAGFPHLCYGSNPEFAGRFAEAACKYEAQIKTGKKDGYEI